MASIYKDKGDKTSALKIYNEIILNYPEDLWTHSWAAIYSGHIYSGLGKYDEAVKSYDKVIKTPGNAFLASFSELSKGEAYLSGKDYDSAEETFQKLIKSSKYFSEEALIGLGNTHFENKEYDLAKEVFQSIGDLFPDSVWLTYAENKMKIIEKKLAKKPSAE
jgi:tetratricopeptide (TPR) repeat protein